MRSSTVRAKEAINEQVRILLQDDEVMVIVELMKKFILTKESKWQGPFVKIWKVSNLEKVNWKPCFGAFFQ